MRVYPPHGTAFSNPPNMTINAPQFALAPDGRSIVFAAGSDGARPLLWRRYMDRLAAEPLPGTEDAYDPFWSPDSRWIGFFTGSELKKVPAAGGPAQVIVSDLQDFRGGTWGQDDTILFALGSGGIQRISSAGGQVTQATALGEREISHRHPQFLPGGRHFVFMAVTEDGELYLYGTALGEPGKKLIAKMDSSASFGGPGYLLSTEGNSLFAYPFDTARLRTTGERVLVTEHTARTGTYRSAVSSAAGTIAYADILAPTGTLTWFDRNGATLGTVGPEGYYTDFRLSPSGEALAATRLDRQRGRSGPLDHRFCSRQHEPHQGAEQILQRLGDLVSGWREGHLPSFQRRQCILRNHCCRSRDCAQVVQQRSDPPGGRAFDPARRYRLVSRRHAYCVLGSGPRFRNRHLAPAAHGRQEAGQGTGFGRRRNAC